MFDNTALLFACCRCTAIDEHILSSAFITLHKNTNFSNTSPDLGRKRCLIKLESILYHHQRDQMMEYKLPNFPQYSQKVAKSSFTMSWIFKNSPNIYPNILGYFCKKICAKKLKIAQSGHTGSYRCALCHE